ncbi:MAG: hypothetical protein FJZ56_05765 [Chlamydiae bacterium]|nr:hypothetical protein [Chlamydiota bacterium]
MTKSSICYPFIEHTIAPSKAAPFLGLYFLETKRPFNIQSNINFLDKNRIRIFDIYPTAIRALK